MASKAAPAPAKSTPAQQPDHNAATNAKTTTPTATTNTSSSRNTNSNTSSSLLPAIRRRRRDSSGDFDATGSLGSIGGSAVGSSVEFSASGGGGAGVEGNSNINNSSSNNSNSKTRTSSISPSGRRPFRKRKASVDFSFPALSMDDNDASYSIANTALLPQHHRHHATTPAPATTTAPVAGKSISSSLLGSILPSSSTRCRLYSDLTMNESLAASNSSSKQQQQQNNNNNNNNNNSNSNSKQKKDQEQILPSMDALPPMEDLLPHIDNDTSSILLHPPESPTISGNTLTNHSTQSSSHNTHTLRRDRALSFASSVKTEGRGLDRLDTLGVEATLSASRIRKGSSLTSEKSHGDKSQEASENSSANNSYDGTLGSQSHRFLMEAFLGDGTESLVLNPSQRERLGSFDAAATVTGKSYTHTTATNNNNNNNNGISSNNNNNNNNNDDNNNIINNNNNNNNKSSSGENILISRERLSSIGGRRDRLESWGGMSDLSYGMKDQNLESLGIGNVFTGTNNNSNNAAGSAAAPNNTASALAATIYTSLANDVTAAAQDGNESVSSFLVNDESFPTRMSTNRDRSNTMATMQTIATDQSSLLRTHNNALSGLDSEFPSDVHSFVKAAMASVEDQLADLATAVEAVSKDNNGDHESEISSTVSPMIGAASDIGSNISDSVTGRPRSSSISSLLQIAVDYDAVAAAVDAAEAAAGAIDLTNFTSSSTSKTPSITSAGISSSSSVGSHHSQMNHKKRALPLLIQKKKSRTSNKNSGKLPPSSLKSSKNRTKKRSLAAESIPSAKKQRVATNSVGKKPPNTIELKLPMIPKSKMDNRDMEKLRERARAAAGYVPPSATGSSIKATSLPPKKRTNTPMTPSTAPRPSMTTSGSNFKTPIASNTGASKYTTPHSAYSRGTPSSATPKGQSSQKWESMFECLVKFIAERKTEATAGMTDEQIKVWSWDGNVPTTFKTKDGKALGRWVNNQRSAKSKNTLKDERETRLVNAGLKWSVLASNSWNEMLEELRVYVNDQIQQGKKWDGNVPTNYRIKVSKDKAKLFVKDDDEDKNLGRWVNRQRSMFQAGKLRKDRQLSLENIGLKWSMLATTSWESMFETLCQYVEEKKKGGAEWDGNVPANYRTEDMPPRALGRWINRQRSAYGKNKLKTEYVAKLNEIGLKWSIHERRPTYHQYTSVRPETASSSTAVPELALSSSTPTHTTDAAKPQVALAASGLQKDANASDKENNTIIIESVRPDHIGSSNKEDTHNSEAIDKNTQGVATATTAVTHTAAAASTKLETGVNLQQRGGTDIVVEKSIEASSTGGSNKIITDFSTIANEGNVKTGISKEKTDSKVICDDPKEACQSIPIGSEVGTSTKPFEELKSEPRNAVVMPTTSTPLSKAPISSKEPVKLVNDSAIMASKAIDSTKIEVTPATPSAGNTTTDTIKPESGAVVDSTKPSSSPPASKVESTKEIIAEKPVNKVKQSSSSTATATAPTLGNVTTDAIKIKQESIEKSVASSPAIPVVGRMTTKESVDKSTVSSSAIVPTVGKTTTEKSVDKSIASSPAIPAVGKTTTDQSVDKSTISSSAIIPSVGKTTTEKSVDKSIASFPAIPAVGKTTTDQSAIIPSVGKMTSEESVDTKSTVLSPVIPAVGKTTTEESVDKSIALSSAKPAVGNTATVVTSIKQESVDK